jgi:hypothetical protein
MSFTVPLPPRTQFYNRSCSNKHTHVVSHSTCPPLCKPRRIFFLEAPPRDGQTSSHRPRLVVSSSTCPPLPPPPPTNSFVIGTAVINTPANSFVIGIAVTHIRPGWAPHAPDPLMVGIRSPDGLVVGSCTIHPGVLGSIPKRPPPLANSFVIGSNKQTQEEGRKNKGGKHCIQGRKNIIF